MSRQQDQDWIDETIKGNMNAYSSLIDAYKHMVFTLAVKIAAEQGRGRRGGARRIY